MVLAFTVTEKALAKVLSILESEGRAGQGLRVSAAGGGAHGLSFALNFVNGPGEPDDRIVVTTEPGSGATTARSLSLFIDPSSAQLLEGGSMDYVEALSGAGFKFHAPRAHALRAVPPAAPSPTGTAPDPAKPSGPQAERVQEILDTLVNPGVASHGGWVGLVDIKDNVVYLRLGGGCHGCGQVNVTLKQGIEVMIKERMPEISAVYDTTDHAEGKNPYYAPARH